MITLPQLQAIPLLAGLAELELAELGAVLTSRKVKKGNFIVYADDPGPSLMFIHGGSVKISLLSDDGKEIVLSTMGPGEFFGELALLTGEDRSANVIAQEATEVFVLSEEDFNLHILKNNGLSRALLRELAFRLQAATAKIGDLALFDVYRRVARTLKSIGENRETPDGTVSFIEKRPTHQELASMVGTSREMVTRALKGLEEDGCIEMDGKSIRSLRPRLD